jgi:type I restriction enzyme R subunit
MAGNGLEFEHTEKPLIEQLTSMPGTSWRHVHGVVANEFQPKDPHQSFRSSFEESILEKILRDHLKKLNVNDDGQPWLDDDRVSQAVAALTRGTVAAGNSLLAANEAATRLLLEGTTVPGLLDSHGGRAQPVHYIDWQHPERNDFLAISQFRMNVPGTQGREYLVPDIVLFVNGIPLVVIECKKPVAADGALHAAIDQLRRDANQDGANRGSDRLFRTVQLTVATTMDDARLGTFTSRRKDYNRWNDPYPYSRNELATVLGRSGPNAAATLQPQETLTATVLYPDRLLDIVQNFVVFRDVDVADGETRRVKPALLVGKQQETDEPIVSLAE